MPARSPSPEAGPGLFGTALVTGAGSGIGLATAWSLAERGFTVVMASLEGAPPTLPPQARYVCTDIADLDGHAALLDSAGPLTCLVNCAGVTSLMRGDLLELSPESYDRTMGVNLRGTFFLSQAAARCMLTQTGPGRSIVTVGSINATILGETRADYCMSKAGLGMMTKLLASRLGAAGIAVFEVRPGIIRTPMTEPATARYDALLASGGVPMGRWGTAQDVADVITTLASGGLPYTTGVSIEVAGGLHLHRI